MNVQNHDLSYQPDGALLDDIRGRVHFTRVLIVGTQDGPSTTGTCEARRADQPPTPLGNGLYVFRSVSGWDAMVVAGGTPPTHPAAVNEGDDGQHPLFAARRWFDYLWANASPIAPERAFPNGAFVRVAGTERAGQVETATFTDSGWRYTVVLDLERKQVLETGLEGIEVRPDDPTSWVEIGAGTAGQLAAVLTHTKLSNPLTDTLYSYLSTKTVFRPYQFRPVLKLLNSPHQRLLIADEVGLGKTIEAGLVWVELEQRANARRLLVICPAALTGKWRAEMRRRFDTELDELDAKGIERLVQLFEAGDTETPIHAVVSLERLRMSPLLARLSGAQPTFDLVIVDEAHYMRNSGRASNDLGHVVADWADTLLFLSATPLNLGQSDLFNLLNILVEDEYPDAAVFPGQVEPNRYLNRAAALLRSDRHHPSRALAALDGIGRCQFGSLVTDRLEFTRLRTLLERDDALPWEELAEARRLILELNTLSGVLTRTRKADVPDKRAVREPVRIDVAWSVEEAALYRQIMSWTHLRALKNGHPPGFAMQMPLRQAASCLPAMLEQLKARNPEASGAEALADFDEDSQVKAGDLDQWVDQALVQLIRTANTPTKDSKLEAFVAKLDEARRNGLGQMMVFSFFRKTLEYLRQQLSQEGWKVRVMHGGTAMKDRERIMQEYRDGAFEVLLCSEVASEGLDFEFCNVLVNYDLPWNPMKVEQRIGRLDRFGQQHDKIFIYNFHVPGTIETDIFERLYDRINVFRESIGELEPILRDEFGDLHREALDLALSPEQLEARMAEIELAIVNRRVDLANLADAEDLLSAVDQFLIDGLERDTQRRGRFLGKRELRRFVSEFLWTATRTRLPGRDDDDRSELVGDSDLADALTRILSRSPRDLAAAQPFLRRLRNQEPINLTFDNEDANRTSFELVSIRHPLVRAATLHTAERDDLRRYGSVRLTRKPPAEDHVVVVYLAETTGLRGSLELWPVTIRVSDGAVVDDVGDRLFQALTEGSFADAEPIEPAVVGRLATAAGDHVHRIQAARETERRRDNEALVSARMEAQRASIELKIARAQQRLADARAAGHRQIARLHEGHIANLWARLDQSLAELARRRNLAVTVAPVAVISLRGKNRVR